MHLLLLIMQYLLTASSQLIINLSLLTLTSYGVLYKVQGCLVMSPEDRKFKLIY